MKLRGADAVGRSGRPYPACRQREARWDPARSKTPCTRGSTASGTGRSRGPLRPGAPPGASESPRTHADDARPREVGPPDSTEDAAEQRRGTGCGGSRGKRADQGELARWSRRPDTAPDLCVGWPRASTSGSQADPVAAVHLDGELGARCGHSWRDHAWLHRCLEHRVAAVARICLPDPNQRLAFAPEVGAGCGSSARPDLWRGCPARGIPTPTAEA